MGTFIRNRSSASTAPPTPTSTPEKTGAAPPPTVPSSYVKASYPESQTKLGPTGGTYISGGGGGGGGGNGGPSSLPTGWTSETYSAAGKVYVKGTGEYAGQIKVIQDVSGKYGAGSVLPQEAAQYPSGTPISEIAKTEQQRAEYRAALTQKEQIKQAQQQFAYQGPQPYLGPEWGKQHVLIQEQLRNIAYSAPTQVYGQGPTITALPKGVIAKQAFQGKRYEYLGPLEKTQEKLSTVSKKYRYTPYRMPVEIGVGVLKGSIGVVQAFASPVKTIKGTIEIAKHPMESGLQLGKYIEEKPGEAIGQVLGFGLMGKAQKAMQIQISKLPIVPTIKKTVLPVYEAKRYPRQPITSIEILGKTKEEPSTIFEIKVQKPIKTFEITKTTGRIASATVGEVSGMGKKGTTVTKVPVTIETIKLREAPKVEKELMARYLKVKTIVSPEVAVKTAEKGVARLKIPTTKTTFDFMEFETKARKIEKIAKERPIMIGKIVEPKKTIFEPIKIKTGITEKWKIVSQFELGKQIEGYPYTEVTKGKLIPVPKRVAIEPKIIPTKPKETLIKQFKTGQKLSAIKGEIIIPKERGFVLTESGKRVSTYLPKETLPKTLPRKKQVAITFGVKGETSGAFKQVVGVRQLPVEYYETYPISMPFRPISEQGLFKIPTISRMITLPTQEVSRQSLKPLMSLPIQKTVSVLKIKPIIGVKTQEITKVKQIPRVAEVIKTKQISELRQMMKTEQILKTQSLLKARQRLTVREKVKVKQKQMPKPLYPLELIFKEPKFLKLSTKKQKKQKIGKGAYTPTLWGMSMKPLSKIPKGMFSGLEIRPGVKGIGKL